MELYGRAFHLLQMLLIHAPRLQNLRLLKPTMLDVTVFELFRKRKGQPVVKVKWDALEQSDVLEDWT